MSPALLFAGRLVGGAAAWSLSSMAGPFLFGLDARDPRAYGAAIGAVGTAALVAAALPARRAVSVNPLEATGTEWDRGR